MKYILSIGLLIIVVATALWFVLVDNKPEIPVPKEEPPSITYVSETFTFYCTDEATFTIQYDATAEFAKLSLNGVQYALTRQPTASGARYEGVEGRVAFWEHQDEATVRLPGSDAEFTCASQPLDESETMIRVTEPQVGVTVGSPIALSGQARGYWFFEASAPVVVVNWDGLIIGESFVTATEEWMTEEFVPFTGTIAYDLPADSYSASGTIIFMRDNPSGLPENDAAVEVPVMLQKSQ